MRNFSAISRPVAEPHLNYELKKNASFLADSVKLAQLNPLNTFSRLVSHSFSQSVSKQHILLYSWS